MATSTLRAAIYARQSVKVDEGIKEQVKDCRIIAEQVRGWIVSDDLIFEDNAVGAFHARGPGTAWGQMLAAYDRGDFDVLVVVSVDRLLRRVVDVVELRRRNMRIVTTRDGIDTATPMGNVVLTILVALAEGEIETKRARNIPYAQNRRAAGHPWPGRVPFGYRWVPKLQRDAQGTRWAVVEAEAAIVRRVYAEYLAGASMRQIARDLNADGYTTRTGTKWGATSIQRMLVSPFYAALLPTVQGWADFDPSRVDVATCIPGAWEALVPVEQYLASRAKVEANPAQNGGNTARKWLLSGLAICDVCRKPVISAQMAGNRGYRCHADNGGHFQRKADVIDDFVSGVAIARLSRPDAIDLLQPANDGPDLAVLNAQREAHEGRGSEIARLVAAGKLSGADAEQALDDLAAELARINKAIAAAVNVDPLAEAVTSGDVLAWWEGASLARRRAVIDALFVPVIRRVGPGRRVNLANVDETLAFEWRVAA